MEPTDPTNPKLDHRLSVKFAQVLAAYDFVKGMPPGKAKRKWAKLSDKAKQDLVAKAFKDPFFAGAVLSCTEIARDYGAYGNADL